MKKKYLTYMFLTILSILLVSNANAASQPTQQYNKILLSPFYVNSMTQNVNYIYNVSVIVPDGISQVKTAIITLDAWINPTRTFNAWVNNIQCNTKNYTISTTYASAGRGVVTFDCTNAIIPNQLNTVTFRVTGGNIGSSTAWLDLTYMNNPKGDITVHGTEYVAGQPAKLWLQLLDSYGDYVIDGACYLDIYTPDNDEYVENVLMTNMVHDGIYYYDLTAPIIEGVYPAIAKCYYTVSSIDYYATAYYLINGSVSTNIPFNMFQDGGANRTNEVLVANDGLSYKRNADGIGKAQQIVTTTNMINGTKLTLRVFGDSAKSIIVSNSALSVIYATIPITTSYATYEVYLENITGSVTTLYLSDGTQAGGFDITFDYVNIQNYNLPGNISKTYTIDGDYLRFTESITTPARVSAILNFTDMSSCLNISEGLLTGITFTTTARFDSVINDNVRISIYNWTSNYWEQLPNQIFEGGSWSTVTNTITLNNITTSGYYNITKGLLIKYDDTNLTDTTRSDLDIDYASVSCNQLTNQTWQEVKGSSEMHINPPASINPALDGIFAYTNCGDDNNPTLSSACGVFQWGEYFTEPQGWINDTITVINNRQTDVNTRISYETQTGVDCTAILDISMNKNDIITDIYNEVTFSGGSLGDNCIITIPIIFTSIENDLSINILLDNYMLWEANRDNRLVAFYRQPITTDCTQIGTISGINLTVPITTDLAEYSTNTILTGCWQTMDDLYWFDDYYTTGLTATTSGEFSSSLAGLRFYYPEIINAFNTVNALRTNTVPLFETITDCQKIIGAYSEANGCEQLMNPDTYFSSQEGWVLSNITFVNTYQTHIESTYEWVSARDIDCTAILDVIKVDEFGNEIDIYDNVTMHGGNYKNCVMTVPIIFEPNETSFDILIKMENYVHWNMHQMNDKINALKNNTETFCQQLLLENNVSYYLPINASIDYVTNPDARFCWRALDDLYWYNFFYIAHNNNIHDVNHTSYLFELMGDYAEFEYFYPFIIQNDNIIRAYQRSENQVLTLSLLQSVGATVWNYTDRSLTYYSDTTNYTRIDETIYNINQSIHLTMQDYYTNIINAINNAVNTLPGLTWNYTVRNLTYYPEQVDLTNYTLISENVWVYPIRNLTYYPVQVDLTNYSRVSNITPEDVWMFSNRSVTEDITNYSLIINGVWSYPIRNLTYYPVQVDLTNYTLINEGVWLYNNRNLTYYPVQVDLTNYTLINEGVWNYNNRSLTYYEVNNITPEQVWNYMNRTLSYYEVNNISAEDIWIYNNRTLTYYPQYDTVNYTKIVDDVWNYSARYTHGVEII